jgi:hypothetical protein
MIPKKTLFNKANLKYFFIWLISLLLSGLLKLAGYLNPNVLIINNFLLVLLVFGPALLVTIILVFNKFSNS